MGRNYNAFSLDVCEISRFARNDTGRFGQHLYYYLKIGNIVGGYGKFSYLCCCFFTAIKFMAIKFDTYEIL